MLVALLTSKSWHAQFLRYFLIGVSALAIDFGLLATLVRAQYPLTAAVIIAYGVAAAFHFTFNKFWTFKSYARPHKQILAYACIVIITGALTVLIVQYCVVMLKIPVLISKLIAVALTFPLSFIGHRRVTFGT